jgi:hypothetical protein
MRREGHYVRSKTDYILAQELSDFRRWAIKIPRVNTDHRAIIAEMKLGRLSIFIVSIQLVEDAFQTFLSNGLYQKMMYDSST